MKKLVSPRSSSNNVTATSKMSKINSRRGSGSPFNKGTGNFTKHKRSRTGLDTALDEK